MANRFSKTHESVRRNPASADQQIAAVADRISRRISQQQRKRDQGREPSPGDHRQLAALYAALHTLNTVFGLANAEPDVPLSAQINAVVTEIEAYDAHAARMVSARRWHPHLAAPHLYHLRSALLTLQDLRDTRTASHQAA